jgi:hypothetical protein
VYKLTGYINFGMQVLVTITLTMMISCSKKEPVTPPSPVPPVVVPSDTTTLKQMASYPVGVAINYDLMKGNASYSSLVKKEFDRVTFEYQMKHGANVKTMVLMIFPGQMNSLLLCRAEVLMFMVIHWYGIKIIMEHTCDL